MNSRRITRDGRDWIIPDAFYRISVKVLIKDEESRLLVVQDRTDSNWEIPGGGIDHDESIQQAAKREIREELGVELLELDNGPIAITLGEHPNNYLTLMLYYRGKLSSYDFTLEKKFNSKFVDQDEFMKLNMMSDEAPIKKHTGKIWQS